MLSTYETAIVKEIERRELINNIIDFLLYQSFRFSDNKFHKVKRGDLHNFIAVEMKVDLNNTLCTLIKERIEEQGGVARTINGTQYYLHVIKI